MGLGLLIILRKETHPSVLGNCSCIALTAYVTHMDVGNAE